MKKSVTKKRVLQIRRFQTPFYNSVIEITKKNKNYIILNNVDKILKKNNLQWCWFFKRLNIELSTLKTYFSGAENISMLAIEKMASVLKPYINNPKELMNCDFPILRLGKEFKLNLGYITRLYKIRQHEIAFDLKVDSSWVSMVTRGKTSQISPDKLTELYKYLKRRGVPLRNSLDLIYFPSWSEEPGHFIKKKSRQNVIFKYNSSKRG